MRTILRNIVDNAIRYTPDGGQVDLSVCQSEAWVEIRIEDSGPGIPAAERQRVFDPFYRQLGTEQPGTGLGLSIVKTMADRLALTLELSDRSDGQSGLCVTLRVPPHQSDAN